jgi:polyphosphate glucokinase
VLNALDAFEEMVLPDHVYIGGGNAKRLDEDELGPHRTIVPNVSGLLGGIALWERTGDAIASPIAHEHATEAAPGPAGG